MVSSKLKKKKKKPKQVEKTDAEEPVAAAPQETVQKRPRKKKKKPVLFGGESSIDRTPIPSTFWHRPPTSDVLAAKDDFESLGLVGTNLVGMPTEAMFREAAQRRAFAIRTDHYKGATREAGWYATLAHLKVHEARARLMKHPAIAEDWAGLRSKATQQRVDRFGRAVAAASHAPPVGGVVGSTSGPAFSSSSSSSSWGRRVEEAQPGDDMGDGVHMHNAMPRVMRSSSTAPAAFPQIALVGTVGVIALLAGLARATAVLLSSRRKERPPLASSELKGASSI